MKDNRTSVKRSLLVSAIALTLTAALLIGSTFAWFTSTATTSVSDIKAGQLTIDIVGKDGKSLKDSTLSFKNVDGSDSILWEPGATYSLDEFTLVNTGNLALKYKVTIDGVTGNEGLLNVIDFTVKQGDGTAVPLTDWEGVLLPKGATATTADEKVEKTDPITISGTMKSDADNTYQNQTLTGIKIAVTATQYTYEKDIKDNQYDKDASYAIVNVSNEKELRTALYNAPTDGTGVKVVLQNDITLDMLYAAENLPASTSIQDYETGDTLNRYKTGVHPTAEDPNHWNPLVTNQTDEEKAVYGAYYNMGAGDERIARLIVKANQDVVIDLNGHTIAKADRATHGDWSNTCTDIIGNYGWLKVTDSASNGVVKGHGYISCNGAVLHNYGGTMIVENVKVDGNADGMTQGTGQYVIVNDGGSTTINNANVYDTGSKVDASLLVNTAGMMTITGNTVLNHPNTKTINVKGGHTVVESAEITSNKYSIYAKAGTVEVTDANVTVTGGGQMTEAGGTITHK